MKDSKLTAAENSFYGLCGVVADYEHDGTFDSTSLKTIGEAMECIKVLNARNQLVENKLRRLCRSAAMVADSLKTDNFIPEFRYKDFDRFIKEAREILKR